MKIFLNEKNVNLTKQEQFLKGFAITYNVEILIFFLPWTDCAFEKKLEKIFSESFYI